MHKFKLIERKRELRALIHLNQLVSDYADIIKLDGNYDIFPTSFINVCRDFMILIDDSPYVTEDLKHTIDKFIMRKVHQTSPLKQPGITFQRFSDYISDVITNVRASIIYSKEYNHERSEYC